MAEINGRLRLSQVLLALLMKNDTEGTLLCTNPLELTFFVDERDKTPDSLLQKAAKAALHFMLMVPWCCRSPQRGVRTILQRRPLHHLSRSRISLSTRPLSARQDLLSL